MKTIIDYSTNDELIDRIASLNENSIAQWGKMNVSQMIAHCLLWDEMALGKTKFKQAFIGRLFGKIALKSFIKDDKFFPKNVGSLQELIVTETNEQLEFLKNQWSASLERYKSLADNHEYVHAFFGRMNKHQTGRLAYKHADHHLRQFGA
ncbi:MAG: hypothetical protein BGN92_07400 [Sphingobacteriales bacterium 41-5]|mgnify:CR=1 FL=1|nr:MAG: hypothetical protein BGN92_07400 [Sphingobacteriales bacterium 41-5]